MARGTSKSDPLAFPGTFSHYRFGHADCQTVRIVFRIGEMRNESVCSQVLVRTEQLPAVRGLKVQEDIVRDRRGTLRRVVIA
jgi:hypothetical protein